MVPMKQALCQETIKISKSQKEFFHQKVVSGYPNVQRAGLYVIHLGTQV